MSRRKVRHIRARHDEWIQVHRQRPDDGCLGIVIAVVLLMFLFKGCS
ncbi:MAG: hypothetical protein IT576_10815 [Verrucomicrobiales bacterium]|nr:hypothetical protein [Verrucomicrobiales bacterium]